MKVKGKLIVLGFALALAGCLGACSNTEDGSHSEASIEESSSVYSSSSDNTYASSSYTSDEDEPTVSDYLRVKPETISDFKLSPMVKDVVGTYSGIQAEENFDDHISQYQVRIKADGSYVALSRKLTVLPDNVTNYNLFERVYFDENNAMQFTLPGIERNGKRYSYDTRYTLERGVVIEKYGKLHFRALSKLTTESNNHQSTFTTTDGQSNLALDLVSHFMVLHKVPDTEGKFQSFIEENFDFDIPFSTDFSESQSYASDGKVYLYGLELEKSDDVDPIVARDLDQLITWKNVSTIFSDPNGILQVWAIKKGIYQYEKPNLVVGVGDAKVYEKNGDSITPKVAFRDEENKRLYVYWNGVIDGITEVNGTYVLNQY